LKKFDFIFFEKMALHAKNIISSININEEGHIIINFTNNQNYIFTKENFTINKYNKDGLIFTKGNKKFIIKMKVDNLDTIINIYNGN